MSKYIPVEPEKWGEMVRALSENTSLKADIDRLRSRYAEAMDEMRRLKAEVESLKEGNEYLGQMHDKEMERSAYLCEQVERLEKGIQPEGSNDAVGRAVNVLLEKEKENARLKAECQARQAENSVLAVECDSLKAEVERLTELNATLSLRYDATKSMLDGCAKEIEEMEAEVERLRKAGDDLSASLTIHSNHPNCGARDEWLRAKKGLPSLAQQWEREKNNNDRDAKEGKQS